MDLSLETLQALAACNPFRWNGVLHDEKIARMEVAGLLPYVPDGHNPCHQTFVTKAVIEWITQEDPASAQVLRNRLQSDFIDSTLRYLEAADERAVFDWIDQMVVERKREALAAMATPRLDEPVARRAM